MAKPPLTSEERIKPIAYIEEDLKKKKKKFPVLKFPTLFISSSGEKVLHPVPVKSVPVKVVLDWSSKPGCCGVDVSLCGCSWVNRGGAGV